MTQPTTTTLHWGVLGASSSIYRRAILPPIEASTRHEIVAEASRDSDGSDRPVRRAARPTRRGSGVHPAAERGPQALDPRGAGGGQARAVREAADDVAGGHRRGLRRGGDERAHRGRGVHVAAPPAQPAHPAPRPRAAARRTALLARRVLLRPRSAHRPPGRRSWRRRAVRRRRLLLRSRRAARTTGAGRRRRDGGAQRERRRRVDVGVARSRGGLRGDGRGVVRVGRSALPRPRRHARSDPDPVRFSSWSGRSVGRHGGALGRRGQRALGCGCRCVRRDARSVRQRRAGRGDAALGRRGEPPAGALARRPPHRCACRLELRSGARWPPSTRPSAAACRACPSGGGGALRGSRSSGGT